MRNNKIFEKLENNILDKVYNEGLLNISFKRKHLIYEKLNLISFNLLNYNNLKVKSLLNFNRNIKNVILFYEVML